MPGLAFMIRSKPITIRFTPTMHLVSTVVFEDNASSPLSTSSSITSFSTYSRPC